MSNELAEIPENAANNLSGADKSAILLMSLGEDDAAKVLQHMGPKEVQKIGMAMAELKNVQKDTVVSVLDVFLDVVEDTLGTTLEIPSQIQKVMGKEKKSIKINTYGELKTFLINRH